MEGLSSMYCDVFIFNPDTSEETHFIKKQLVITKAKNVKVVTPDVLAKLAKFIIDWCRQKC